MRSNEAGPWSRATADRAGNFGWRVVRASWRWGAALAVLQLVIGPERPLWLLGVAGALASGELGLCLGLAPQWVRRLERAERSRKAHLAADFLDAPLPKEESFMEGLGFAGMFLVGMVLGPLAIAATLMGVCWLGTKLGALAPFGAYVNAHFGLCWFIAVFFATFLLDDVVDRWQLRKRWRMAEKKSKAA